MKVKLLSGDCLEVLKGLDPNSVDSLVTDPPAGISFMGKDWDKDKGGRDAWIAWMSEVMAECMRVMKPGAHGLVWAIPRTSHWTATALENAGLEVRDVVTHLFGSGFPKSLNISKAIDKAAGAEREVVGSMADINPRYATPRNHAVHGGGIKSEAAPTITAPATDAAKQWDGFGTALKPASEHWILIRKPISEKTVAANVLKWGCGGLNIDASRIATDELTPRNNNNTPTLLEKGFEGTPQTINPSPLGRFPANLILSHNDDCELVGSKEIKTDSHKADMPIGFGKRKYKGNANEPERKYTETVEAWQCTPDCAVAGLDEQSGSLSPQGGRKKKDCPSEMFAGGSKDSTFYGDTGGASRFFYCAKASKRDKGANNTHPTVKSTKLMEYLIRLVTAPGGVVLDPFMGSGSTGVAANNLGFGFVGIEQDKEYLEIALKRIG